MKGKVVREGLIDISTGKRLGKKKVIKIKEEEKPKTRWQKIVDWLNTPVGGG